MAHGVSRGRGRLVPMRPKASRGEIALASKESLSSGPAAERGVAPLKPPASPYNPNLCARHGLLGKTEPVEAGLIAFNRLEKHRVPMEQIL
jgi:hypothetical protein